MVKTVVLCDGRDLRLRPLTDAVPKPLVPLNGRALLQRLVESYIRKGFRRFV
jgi:MurNAc alpha-1-phosphate uridylyltransferase